MHQKENQIVDTGSAFETAVIFLSLFFRNKNMDKMALWPQCNKNVSLAYHPKNSALRQ